MTVLVVDDERLVRLSLERALKTRGHQVMTASDGLEGLTLWRAHHPGLVFLDVLMPALSGPQVLAQIGTHTAQVVLMSAFTGEHDLASAQELGANLFIAKPFADIFHMLDDVERQLK